MTLHNVLQLIYASIGRLLVVGGGAAVVAYALFQWLGKAWLDQYFRKQLERFKHDQQKELEQLRHQINALFSRISKIHEKEFEILPKAWQLLHEAHGAAYQLIKAFRQWPNLDVMPEGQLEAFLAATRLAEFQKDEIRGCGNKLKRYQEVVFWYELDDAKKTQIELNNYLAVNSIFVTETLRQQFREISKLLPDVIVHEQIARERPSTEAAESASARTDRIEAAKSARASMDRISEMFNGIEAEVQRRLRYEDA